MKWKGAAHSKRSWTPERDEELRALAKTGLPIATVAVRMGKNVGDVRSRAATLKIRLQQSAEKDQNDQP